MMIWREEGASGLFRRIVRKAKQAVYRGITSSYALYAHPHLPEKNSHRTCNGVVTSEKNRYLDSLVPFSTPTADYPGYKAGNVEAIQRHVEGGDTVVVVGGGSGVTAVAEGRAIGENGDLTVYEGSKLSIDELETTFSLNPVDCSRRSIHAIVGPEETVPGADIDGAELVPVDDLPNCDVLELDCEGAEEEILRNLKITPRVIIVETHPYVGVSTDTIRAQLEDSGYEIVDEFADASAGWIIPDGKVLVGHYDG